MFDKPKNLTPESFVKAVLNSPQGARPEDVAKAVTENKKSPNLLGAVAKQVLNSASQQQRSSPPPRRGSNSSSLDKAIIHLASQHEGVLSCPIVSQSLRISRYEAQAGLDSLANRNQCRRVRGRHEVVYLFEQYLDQEKPAGGGAVKGIIGAAIWAYGRWNDHQKSLAEQEQRLLDLAYHNRGWFTHTEAVHAIPRGAVECIERLKEAGLVEQMMSKTNQPVYVVAQFLPPTVECGYCHAIYDVGEVTSCRKCGATIAT